MQKQQNTTEQEQQAIDKQRVIDAIRNRQEIDKQILAVLTDWRAKTSDYQTKLEAMKNELS